MKDSLTFVVYCTPTPQGSKRGWVIPGKNGGKPRAIVADANSKTKPYRQAISQTVIECLAKAPETPNLASARVPVSLTLGFYFAKPKSARKRIFPSVKPDIDKLVRSTLDALTGILFEDDAQVVDLHCGKYYGSPERVEITMRSFAGDPLRPISDEVETCVG